MTRRAVCLVLGLAISAAAPAVPNRWTSIGPPGGWVRSIAVHPSNPATAWLAAYPGGVLRTDDGGASWRRLPVHTPPSSETATLVAVDPTSPNTLLMCDSGGAIFRSTDGGLSWALVSQPPSGRVQALVISSANPSVTFAGTTTSLYRSEDRGTSWTHVFETRPAVGLRLTGVSSIAVDPTNPRLVYAGATSSDFLRSTDGGLTFTSGPGPSSALSLAIDPSHPNILYAAEPAFNRGVSRSTDAGVTWTSANAGLTDSNTRSVAVDPADPTHVWVACDGGGVFRSIDRAASWAPVASGLVNPFGNAIAFGAGGAHAYVGYTGAGVFDSADHGATWSDSRLPAGYVQKLAWSGSSLVAGVYGVGIEKTSSSGADWSIGSDGLTYPDFQDLAVSRLEPRNMAMGTFGAIFSSRDGGSTWTTYEVLNCMSVTYDAGDARTIYAALYPSGVLRSTDAGLTWTPVTDPAGVVGYTYMIRADPSRSGVVFAVAFGFLYRSTDGAQNWQRLAVNDTHYLQLVGFDSDPRYVYVSGEGHFFRSADAGLTWTDVGTISPGIVSLANVPGRPGSLYAAARFDGVFQSDDFGSTWTPVNSGLETYDVLAVQVDPANASKVYVATNGYGVYALDRTGSPAGPCFADGSTLCLNGNRFRVRVNWRVPSQGTSGEGTAVSLTGDTGYFWFFSSNNVELVVKVVDGTPLNAKYWVFSGALTDVGYDIVVLDTVSGLSKTYTNPQGTLASFADTSAF